MKAYLDLLKTIQEKGTRKPAARTNMPGTTSLFGYQFRHNLQEGFPLLTTKKMFWKGVVVELLWFLRGDTNIKYLVDRGVNIWNEDAYNYYLKKYNDPSNMNKTEPLSFEKFISVIKNDDSSGYPVGFQLGDCGFQYGRVWRNWSIWKLSENYFVNSGASFEAKETGVDQITNLINGLRKSPESRRHIITAWDPAHDQDLALIWCHAMFQFNCRPLTWAQRTEAAIKKHGVLPELTGVDFFDNTGVPKYYLDCQLYQRSADVFLGVPFNIASYALLTHIIARMCNMIPGEFIHTFGDVHIYDNHQEAVKEQLSRTPSTLPKLEMANNVNWTGTIDDFIESVLINDFQLAGYDPQPVIKAELSTGMQK